MTKMCVLLAGVAACLASALTACASHANTAEQVATTIVKGLAPAHPVPICDNGDAGFGLDNYVPWHSAYMFVDRTSGLDQIVVAAAGKAGFHLQVPQGSVKSHTSGTPSASRGGTGRLSVPSDPTTSHLVANTNGRRVEVSVVRTGKVVTYCRDVQWWGRSVAERPGKAIVQLHVTLPERR